MQLERWSGFRVSFEAPKQSVSPKKEGSRKQSPSQVPSCPPGVCELPSWDQSCLECPETSPAVVIGYLLTLRFHSCMSLGESGCPHQHLSHPASAHSRFSTGYVYSLFTISSINQQVIATCLQRVWRQTFFNHCFAPARVWDSPLRPSWVWLSLWVFGQVMYSGVTWAQPPQSITKDLLECCPSLSASSR